MPNYQGNYRERDEMGRFTSEDESRREYGRYNSRYNDDSDSRGSSGRGWYGDSEGHSEAAGRGWGEDGGLSRRGARYEGDGYSRRAHSGGEGRGWYGDPEGHSEAARRGWGEDGGSSHRGSRYEEEDGYSRRGPSYYGEGRSRSNNTEGWGEREYGSRGGRVRYAEEYDGSGRGHGGWFGDHRGHAEAAREGWANR